MEMNAIFFDVDGTLFDTRKDLAQTVNHTRRDLGFKELDEDIVVGYVGQGARHLLSHTIPEARLPFEKLWQIFKTHYAEHCCEQIVPYPGVIGTLNELKARGWLLGINTNKPNFAVKLILEKFGLSDLFGAAIVAGGDGVELKPSANSLYECAMRLNGHELSGDDWMVGDSWTDMQCASNAGVKGVFCEYGFGKLNDSRYTARIRHFDELLNVLADLDILPTQLK